MSLRAHHSQITVPTREEERAREFYRDFLGLPEIEKPDALKAKGGFWLDAGSIQIHVSLEDGVDRARSKAHVAYITDDLAQLRARLEKHGIELKESTPIPGYARLEIRDPFGNRVEFLESLPSGESG